MKASNASVLVMALLLVALLLASCSGGTASSGSAGDSLAALLEGGEPGYLVSELAASVTFDSESGLLRFTVPDGLPDSYAFHIEAAGRVRMGDGGMSVHLFEEETETGAWEAGKTYRHEFEPDSLLGLTMLVGAVGKEEPEASRGLLHETEITIDQDGGITVSTAGAADSAEANTPDDDAFSLAPPFSPPPEPPVSGYPEEAKAYLRASLDGSLLLQIAPDKSVETAPFPGENYSEAALSPNGEFLLVKTDAISQGEARWCGYTVLDLTASPAASHPFDGEQWGFQNHVILGDDLVGFADGNVIGGQEDTWEDIKLFDNRYNKLAVPAFDTPSLSLGGLPGGFDPAEDLRAVGIGYDRAGGRYILAYALDITDAADTAEIPFSKNRLVVAIYGQDGTLLAGHNAPGEIMSLYSRNLMSLTPNNPVVAESGQILLRGMRDPGSSSPSLLVLRPDGSFRELPSMGEGFRLSADGKRAFAIGSDAAGMLTSSFLNLDQPEQTGAALTQPPEAPWNVDGYGQGFTPIDAVMRGEHTYILAESYTAAGDLFAGLFYWDGERAELLQTLPGRGNCGLAGVSPEGECLVMIHGKSGAAPEYEDAVAYIKSLLR